MTPMTKEIARLLDKYNTVMIKNGRVTDDHDNLIGNISDKNITIIWRRKNGKKN